MSKPDAPRPRVVLFRAREDAAQSAARLRGLGFAAVCLPVFEIVARAFAPARARYDAVIATSAKAFLSDPPILRAAPLYVVGRRTGAEAEARGWRLAAPPAPDALRLAEILKGALPPGASVLYLAGRDRKPTLEAALAGAADLEVVEVYAAEARARWRPSEIRALKCSAIGLHYSRRSAALAAGLAEAAGAGAAFREMTHVCLSADAAAPLEADGATTVRIAARPNEDALIAALADATALFPTQTPSRI